MLEQSQPLRADDVFALFRTARPDERDSVLVVTPSAERPSASSLARLERAYLLRHEIDPAWGTRPIAVVVHEGKPALLLEDPGGIVLEGLLGRVDAGQFLRLALCIAESVGQLHDAGLLHHDLKPSNILADTERWRAWLTGLCLASRVSGPDSSDAAPATDYGASLAHMAPERTGRLQRGVDARSDLYSLGVTLYQLATGRMPFVSREPMDWVHSHVAKRPIPPGEQGSRLPPIVDHILLRLLEKDPEDRYQSAAGLIFDLRQCLSSFEGTGSVPRFALASRDTPERLSSRARLYGRETELAQLGAALERVRRSGAPELLLVRGYSGIGKSSLIREFLETELEPSALVGCCKFEDLKGDAPYAALSLALREVCRRVLAKSSAELEGWRAALGRALGGNAALLSQLVPELALIVGRQPALPSLLLDELRNRAFATFRRFFRAITEEQAPLVLFLDDLQWLDTATIELLEHVFVDPELRNVLLIGAYRDHAVAPGDPLERAIRAVVAHGRAVHELELMPLSSSDVARLVADSLHSSPQRVALLSEVVGQKTGGSPFFVGQFLAALAEEGLLHFDRRQRSWGWDLPSIVARDYTENLAELVSERLTRLPAPTRTALRVLACLGGGASSDLLCESLEQTGAALDELLLPAVDARVVTRTSTGYSFPHDRLQETAYSLIPEDERSALHLSIGRKLRRRAGGELDELAFEVARHLNRGAPAMGERAERTELARLDLKLARRSQEAAAHASALGHLEAAWRLLPDEPWREEPELAFQILLARAECDFVVGDRERAEASLEELARRARDPARLGAVVCLQLGVHLTRGEPSRAVEVGVSYLRSVGVTWDGDFRYQMRQQYQSLLSSIAALGGSAAITALPRLEDPDVQAVMNVCATLVSPAYFVDRDLQAWLILYMATLSLQHGNGDASVLAYALLCLVLGPHFDNHALALELGQQSERLLEGGLTRFAARVYLPLGVIIVPRTTGLHAGHALIERVFDAAEKSGDLVYAVYSRTFAVSSLLSSGAPLNETQREAEAGLAYAERCAFPLQVRWLGIQLSLVRVLRGGNSDLGPPSDGAGDDVEGTATRFYFWVRRLQACYLMGDFAGAHEAHVHALPALWNSRMFPEEVELWFYGALAEAAWAGEEPGEETLATIRSHEVELATWAERCPATFANKAALVRAERLRLEGQLAESEHELERAVRLAREHRLVHEEAIAHEVAARFYESRGLRSIAQAKWDAARAGYVQWGALGKVLLLDRRAGVAETSLLSFAAGAIGGPLEQLELSAVVAALRAVSSSLELETLIDGLMRSALQQAAAERALLILTFDEPRVRAEAATRDGAIHVTPLDTAIDPEAMPESVLRLVLRTRERVLIEDGRVPLTLLDDPYLRRRRVLSLLCMPIVVRGEAVGVLYLENGLSAPAFRFRGLPVLDVLASQAAISLENARLYASIHDAKLRMSQAERISRTGSFSFRLVSSEVSWSEEMFRIYELEGPPSLEVMRERTHPDDRALFDAVVYGSSGKPCECRLLMPDASVKHLSIIASPLAGQLPPVYVGTVRDVTESKHADGALQRTQAALADMTRVASLGEMAAAIAHEVNQPLAAIGLNASTCQHWLRAPQIDLNEVSEAVQRITRDAARAGTIVQRLRALFAKSAGVKAPVDLGDAIGEVVALARSRIRAAGANLRVEIAEGLPPAEGDRVQLQQVILNLVTNALEALREVPEGSRELSVRAWLRGDGRLSCEVRDSGRGVPAPERARIFETFYSTKPDGMGIGLSIARNILESHGGELRISDDDAPGATFYFDLPAAARSPT
jgi:predicted ATPase/signal transduction histidine kinase/GAF domain-containing protein